MSAVALYIAMKFYARLVIIYIAIFCIFAIKFAEKAFVHRKKQ
jgi:hypothetical protein